MYVYFIPESNLKVVLENYFLNFSTVYLIPLVSKTLGYWQEYINNWYTSILVQRVRGGGGLDLDAA